MVTFLWIMFDVAISARMMTTGYQWWEVGLWFVGGLGLAIAAWAVEKRDKKADDKKMNELQGTIGTLRQELSEARREVAEARGYSSGKLDLLGQQIATAGRLAASGKTPEIVFDHLAEETNPHDHNLYAHLWFRNEITGGIARHVRANITWTPKNKKGQVLFAGNAKWKDVPWNLGRVIKAANWIDLPPDGQPLALDLCIRKPGAAEFYALDIESPNIGAFGEDRRLQSGVYDVYVELSCDGGYVGNFRCEVQLWGIQAPQMTNVISW